MIPLTIARSRAATASVALLFALGCASSANTADGGDSNSNDVSGDASTSCPPADMVRNGQPCSVDSSQSCSSVGGCAQCFATAYTRSTPSCACVDGTWRCSHVDCGPFPGCGTFSDPACMNPTPCDAGVGDSGARDSGPGDGSVADVPTDAAGDANGTCAPGTCRVAAGRPCEAPTGALGNGCCGCANDGTCDMPCRCAAPDTPIATPDGERPIASLRVGDRVLSIHHGQLVAVALRAVQRIVVRDHHVMRVELRGGRVLSISPVHPTADGRTFGSLVPGDWLGGREVLRAIVVDYGFDATYDILPDSDTGTYVAGGALVGTTMTPPVIQSVEWDARRESATMNAHNACVMPPRVDGIVEP